MSAATRIVYTGPNAYALDPYVRDKVGRFAPKPTEPLPPLVTLESAGEVITLANGAVKVSAGEGRHYWKVRCVREEDGAYRVIYLDED